MSRCYRNVGKAQNDLNTSGSFIQDRTRLSIVVAECTQTSQQLNSNTIVVVRPPLFELVNSDYHSGILNNHLFFIRML